MSGETPDGPPAAYGRCLRRFIRAMKAKRQLHCLACTYGAVHEV